MTQLPLRIGQTYYDCTHATITSLPGLGYAPVFLSTSVTTAELQNLLSQLRAFAPTTETWPSILQAVTLTDDAIAIVHSFALSAVDEYGRSGITYVHAGIFQRRILAELMVERPGFVRNYFYKLYERENAVVLDTVGRVAEAARQIARGEIAADNSLALIQLRTLLHSVGPGDIRTPSSNYLLSERIRIRFTRYYRGAVLRRVTRAIRQGRRVVLWGSYASHDLEFLLDQVLLLLVQLRSKFVYVTALPLDDDHFDIAFVGPEEPTDLASDTTVIQVP